MPISQRALGRDHNPGCQTMWMAGDQIIWNHDVHASQLRLLGVDYKRLTFYFNGRNMRLTGVAEELIPQIWPEGEAGTHRAGKPRVPFSRATKLHGGHAVVVERR